MEIQRRIAKEAQQVSLFIADCDGAVHLLRSCADLACCHDVQ